MKNNLNPWVILIFFASVSAWPCDLCSVYTASRAQGQAKDGYHSGLAEQFTHFGTAKTDGQKIPNVADQALDSSITQFFLGNNLSDVISVQLNVPVIYRSYSRPSDAGIEHGTESGIGDISAITKYMILQSSQKGRDLSVQLLGGVKLPSGNSHRIAEELSETALPDGAVPSGIHGHDLTLGTGSVDGIVGTALAFRQNRFLFQTNAQYAIRTRGSYGYQFANDLQMSMAPGYYIFLRHSFTTSVFLNASGEIKGKDQFQGASADDTGTKSLFLGPQIAATWHDKIAGILALDLPVVEDNTAFQIVPDSRLRLGVTLQF